MEERDTNALIQNLVEIKGVQEQIIDTQKKYIENLEAQIEIYQEMIDILKGEREPEDNHGIERVTFGAK